MSKLTKSFEGLLKSTQLFQQKSGMSFLDSYIENAWNVRNGGVVKNNQGFSEEVIHELEMEYQQLNSLELSAEDWRKTAQLTLLKGQKTEILQANHQMTPDGLAFLFAYLLEQLTSEQKTLTLYDNALGMGNLLFAVMNQLELAGKNVQGAGSEVDDALIAVAEINSMLMDKTVELYLQDGLTEISSFAPDIVLSDFPIGYYPNDEKSKEFKVFESGEHTYAHHLLLESAMKQVKKGGFGLFLLPQDLFLSEQANNLKQWLVEEVYLQAVIQLPETLFQTKGRQKSLYLFQRKGENAKQQEVFAYHLTSLSEKGILAKFLRAFVKWKNDFTKI
ncbi:site-specific DNA-methyltransferase (adenine-specific) [Pilibacter termitis]|uniref:Site-specific DNA-methyltransferase (Adenine-specific) n=1 Tax=Pilibacter termitis TaxID=263852 RepID=A0A1T4PMI3_9ENTE|nr:class I SAM-dependent methyltransferase [Pilibacter termitis]SJZ92466.1 site-specific DNA-methyltransferase (adenine-specific) [Pilibacter termitis]